MCTHFKQQLTVPATQAQEAAVRRKALAAAAPLAYIALIAKQPPPAKDHSK
jgi:hypothetical protein